MKKIIFNIIIILFLFIFINELIFAQQENQNNFYVIKDIKIDGNNRTKEIIILRELKFTIGQKVNTLEQLVNLIDESTQNLYNLQIFAEVRIEYNIENIDEIIIFVKIIEKWTLFPSPGISYNSIYGWTYGFNIIDANFLGYNWNFGLIFSYNEYQKYFQINFNDPKIFNSIYSFLIIFQYRDYIESSYENETLIYQSNIKSYYSYINLSRRLFNNFDIYFDINLKYYIYNTSINIDNKPELEVPLSLIGLGIVYGNVNYFQAIKDGFSVDISFGISPFNFENFEYLLSLQFLFYKIYLIENMICLRFYSFYYYSKIGNYRILDQTNIRGTKNGEIFGNYGLYFNLETHIKLFDLNWPFLIKFYIPIFFDFALFENNKLAYITGFSLKIYPSLINLTIRIDFSFNIQKYLNNTQYFDIYFSTSDYF